MKSLTAMIALGIAALGIAGEAQASLVTYDGTGGTATITATDLTNPKVIITLSGNVFNLATGTGSDVVFDAASTPPNLGSFLLGTSGTVTITGPTVVAGTTIDFSTLSLTSTGATTATSLGGGNYQFLNAGASASAMYSVNGGKATSLTGSTTGLGGSVGIGPTDTLGLTGITLGNITVNGQQISLKADIAFAGTPVPLPPSAWLLLSGLGLLNVPLLRRRRAACLIQARRG
jgi:hypothetical protein